MADFATANIVQRRQMIEDALADALGHILDIAPHPASGERFISVPDENEESRQYSLWDIASEVEAKLS